MRIIFALFMLIAAAYVEAEQPYTGNNLISDCRYALDPEPGKFVEAGRCMGFVSGIVMANEAYSALIARRIGGGESQYQKLRSLCIPDGVTLGQMVRVVTKSIEDVPATSHYSAGVLALTALVRVFPCPAYGAAPAK